MSPLVLLVGGGIALWAWASSRKQEPTEFTLEAGELYEVTLDIGGNDEDEMASAIADVGGILNLDAPEGTIVFEMRPGLDLPVSIPGALPGFGDEVIITEIRKV